VVWSQIYWHFASPRCVLPLIADVIFQTKDFLDSISNVEEPSHCILKRDNAPTQEEDKPDAESRGTILVVDDLSDMRNILHDILHKEGYRVLHSESGRHALQRITSQKDRIDLIITDWMMPEMTGPQLIEELHKLEEFSTIPTILLTAKSDEGSRSEGMRVGASAYIGKPFDQLELISVTENLLDLKRREKKISELNRFINENVLQRFLPPTLVKDLVDGKAVFDDAARMHSITVLFADLVDFTSSTEKLGPTRIARILNSFLVRMTDVIFSEGGTIDKFIGDAILVFFGAPTTMSAAEQIECATRCAQRMQEALEDLNKEWAATEKHAFRMRIGIHHGPAIVGSFGGQKRSDYTAIGHTVNLASRIEGQAQPGETLMTAAVRDFIGEDSWEYAGTFKMKGVESEMALYRLKSRPIQSAA
jgi:class 3 adenylate cyclase/AmiR/NasT family two-component response regulator